MLHKFKRKKKLEIFSLASIGCKINVENKKKYFERSDHFYYYSKVQYFHFFSYFHFQCIMRRRELLNIFTGLFTYFWIKFTGDSLFHYCCEDLVASLLPGFLTILYFNYWHYASERLFLEEKTNHVFKFILNFLV